MNVKTFYEILQGLEEKHEEDHDVIGIRWEEKERIEGEEVGCSKHNLDRDNEDDMPEYGSEEYEEMFELDGASTLEIDHLLDDLKSAYKNKPNASMSNYYSGTHCYVVGGDYTSNESDAIDYGELVIVNAEVAQILY